MAVSNAEKSIVGTSGIRGLRILAVSSPFRWGIERSKITQDLLLWLFDSTSSAASPQTSEPVCEPKKERNGCVVIDDENCASAFKARGIWTVASSKWVRCFRGGRESTVTAGRDVDCKPLVDYRLRYGQSYSSELAVEDSGPELTLRNHLLPGGIA